METKPPREWYEALAFLPRPELESLGMGVWGRQPMNDVERANSAGTGPFLFLFPKDWYDKLPDGLPITYISWEKGVFKHGETDDDYRFGCLAYGILSALP